MNKRNTRLKAFRFFKELHKDIRTKFDNICGKTGRYNVPEQLFQKRTHRSNRALISWTTVKENGFTIEQLESFSSGVTVEFINEDYFLPENQNNPVFIELKNRIGSDETVSAIISMRGESGSSSSSHQREYFELLLNNTPVQYRGETIYLNNENYTEYYLKQTQTGGKGNEKWEGFLFVSLRGGQQNTVESHKKDEEITLFNPAVEYLNEDVSLDLDLSMSYFAMHSIDIEMLTEQQQDDYRIIFENLKRHLREAVYDSEHYRGNLLDYCNNHPSLMIGRRIGDNKLYDPIQVERINIMDFSVKDKGDRRNLELTHDISVNNNSFVWDNHKQCILPPSRPTNVFWSRQLSNMMQQDFTLNDFFEYQEEIIERRRRLLR